MRIGILQTDSVRPELRSQFGDYPDMFRSLLTEADGGTLSFHVIDCQAMRYPRADACDAYLITGSRHSVYDDEPWIAELVRFVERVLAAPRKLIGVCFGHQLLAHFFGGRTEKVGWAVGVHRSEVVGQPPGCESGTSWLQPALPAINLLSSHQDQVVELPAAARPLLRNDFCPNAGYLIGDQVLTIQGHPEFSKPYAQALMTVRHELLGITTFERGIASLQEVTHESEVARWMVNFIKTSG